MSKAPAFQFYANDFMDATRFWEAIACGLYIRCLCIQWTQGGLPADLRILAKGVGMDQQEFAEAWNVVSEKFETCDDGLLRNSRLETVRDRQQQVSESRSQAGKMGAIAKAIAKANAKANEPAKNKQRKVKVKEKVEVEGGSEVQYEKGKLPFESEKFKSSWGAFEQMRKAKRAPMTDRAKELIIADLVKMGESDAIQSLDKSTRNTWTDVYPVKQNEVGTHAATLKTADPNRTLNTKW